MFPLNAVCHQCHRVAHLHRDTMDKSYCCMKRLLHIQPDFQAQRPDLVEYLEDSGHMVLMLPKFHCELNPTEMVWEHLKRNVQSRPGRNGKQTFNEMFMNSMQVLKDFSSLQMVKYANLSERFMSIYEHSMKHNIDVAAVDYIVKRFAS